MKPRKPGTLPLLIQRGQHVEVMRTAIMRQADPTSRPELQAILADVLIFADLEARSRWRIAGVPNGDADDFFRDGRFTHLCEVAGFNEPAVRRFVADVRRVADGGEA